MAGELESASVQRSETGLSCGAPKNLSPAAQKQREMTELPFRIMPKEIKKYIFVCLCQEGNKIFWHSNIL